MKNTIMVMLGALLLMNCSSESYQRKVDSITGDAGSTVEQEQVPFVNQIDSVSYLCDVISTSNFQPCLTVEQSHFGTSMGRDGSWLIVGAMKENNDEGAAYFFHYDESTSAWRGTSRQSSPTPSQEDDFGRAVAIDGLYAFVSSRAQSEIGQDAGAVFVYKRMDDNTWAIVQTIHDETPHSGEFFGRSLAVQGDTLVIGIPHEEEHGSVAIYERNGDVWEFSQKIVGNNGYQQHPWTEDTFGFSVAMDENRLVVGAPGTDGPDGDDPTSGSVFVFEKTGDSFVQTAQLTGSLSSAGDHLGWSVSIDGDRIISGAESAGVIPEGELYSVVHAGEAYIFEYSGSSWSQTAHLFATDLDSGGMFGRDVSILGDYAISAAYRESEGNYPNGTINIGKSYLYHKNITGDWVLVDTYQTPNVTSTPHFGYSVMLSNNQVFVTAPSEDVVRGDDNFNNAGIGYIFDIE